MVEGDDPDNDSEVAKLLSKAADYLAASANRKALDTFSKRSPFMSEKERLAALNEIIDSTLDKLDEFKRPPTA